MAKRRKVQRTARGARPERRLRDQTAASAAALNKGAEQLTARVRESVARILSHPGAEVRDAWKQAGPLAREAFNAAYAAGMDVLVASGSIAKGVMLGVSDAGGDGLKAAPAVVRQAVDAAVAAGEEAMSAGRRAVRGVAEAARATGADARTWAGAAVSDISGQALRAGKVASDAAKQMVDSALAQLGGLRKPRAKAVPRRRAAAARPGKRRARGKTKR
jgi:hypothetical protein